VTRPPSSIRSLPALTWETIATGAAAWLSNGMILPLLLVYLTAARGMSPGFAGGLLAVATICGLICQPIGGYLVDRIGPARAFSTALAIAAAAGVSLAFARDTGTIVLACIASGIGRQMSAATGPALLFSSVPERAQYATASAAQYMVTNACSGLGGLIAGFTADAARPGTFTALFLMQATLLAGASLMIATRLDRRIPRRGRNVASPRRIESDPAVSGNLLARLRSRRALSSRGPLSHSAFRWAFVAIFLFTLFGNQQLFSGLPLHISRIGDQPPQVIGIAFAANTYTIVTMQILALRVLHGRRRSHVSAAMFTATSLAWIAVLLADRQVGNAQAAGFILAAALIGLGEVMLTLNVPPVPALVAPPEQLGRYLSTFSMSRGVVQVIAPTMAGLLVDPLGGALLPAVLLAGALTSGVLITRSARGLPPEVQRI
jgi:MFS family permease